MDSSGLGNFVYSVDIDGADGLYTGAGRFAAAGDAAAALPAGTVYTFLTRPAMTDSGQMYWIAGLDTDANGLTDRRAFYSSPDATHASATIVLQGGDTVTDGVTDFVVSSTALGIDNDYAVSFDGAHRIHVLQVEGSTATDGFVWVDGLLVAREGSPTGSGDNWDNFDLVAVDGAGHYLVTGDTDGVAGSDEFVAYDGVIGVREGDTLDGVTLQTTATLRFAGLDGAGRAVHAWGHGSAAGFRESVFFACDATDLAGTSRKLFSTVDDELDIDGDGLADLTIANLAGTSAVPGRALSGASVVYAEVELDNGVATSEAIVAFPVNCCGDGVIEAPLEDCDDGNADDTDACVAGCTAAACGDGFLWAGMETCDDGNDVDTDDCPTTCVPAACGDGFVQDAVEECDDGNDVDTDDCPTTCVPAACGDGFVRDGAEECDDGNVDDGDGCAADCTTEVAGTSTGDESTSGGSDSTGGVDDTGGDSTGGGNVGTTGLGDTGDEPATGTEGDTDSGGANVDDGGCGCHGGGPTGAGLGWLLVAAAGIRRRRRG
jgi:MYXO-CTERM domain-containing protein